MTYKITFKHGLQNPIVLEANTVEDAKKLAVAHHRKNSGHLETVSFANADYVVDTITMLEAQS